MKRARARLPDVLAHFELARLTEVTVHDHNGAEWAHDLLEAAEADTAKAGVMQTGVIGLTGAMRVEWLSSDPEDVVSFIERFAASRPDNLMKLRNSGAVEQLQPLCVGRSVPRGLGVAATPQARHHGLTPSRAPNLPPEITHVWVAADGEGPSRIVHWTPKGGWQEAGRIE